MKIHAIRGENIASLAGRFEVELEKGVLSQNGLFAITGPTGAGKSTLLDVICLALYDKIPRFDHVRKIEVGRTDEQNREKADDVKTIMHKGSSSCFAEVDFCGADNHLYSSRWFVRRSRNKAGGRLQPQSLSMVNRDTGEEWAGNKSEVLPVIEEKIGLNFDQFRRSVLLAQGDFAAFLKATDSQRAELLEKMTGTGIYAEISRQAFLRNKEEQEVLKELEIRKSGIGLLDSEQIKENQVAIEKLDEKRQLLKQKEDFLNEVFILQSECHLKKENYEESSKRVELEKTKHVELSARKKNAEKEFLISQNGFQETEKQIQVIKPDIDQARSLDAVLHKSQVQLSRLEREDDLKKQSLKKVNNSINQASSEDKYLNKELCSHQDWITKNEDIFKRIPVKNQILTDIERLGTSVENRKKQEKQKKASEKKIQNTEKQIENHKTDSLLLTDKMTLILSEIESSERNTNEYSRENLSYKRKELSGIKENLELLKKSALIIIDRFSEKKELVTTLNETDVEKEKGEVRISEARQKIPELEGSINALEISIREADLAAGLDEKRSELFPGKPCPLCGSEKHPWSEGSPLPGLLSGFRSRLKVIRNQLTALLTGISADTELIKNLKNKKQDAEKRIIKIDRESNDNQALIFRYIKSLPENICKQFEDTTLMDKTILSCDRCLSDTLKEMKQNEHHELKLNEFEKALKRILNTRKNLEKKIDKNRKAIEPLRKQLEEQHVILKKKEINLEREIQIGEDTLHRLLLVYPDTPDIRYELTHNSRDMYDRFKNETRVFEEKQDLVKALETKRKDLLLALVRLEEEKKQFENSISESQSVLAEEQKKHTSLVSEREGLLSGKTVSDMEYMIADTLKKAHTMFENKRKIHDTLIAELAESDGVIKTAQEDVGLNKKEYHQSVRILKQKISKLTIPDHQTDIKSQISGVSKELEDVIRQIEKYKLILENDRQSLKRVDTFRKEIHDKTEKAQVWGQIDHLIGSATGAKFRKFAQGMTLDLLIGYANRYLGELSRRYVLDQVPGFDLEIQIRDREMGDEIRSVSSLSGGESFLVSLALALGLSGMTSSMVSVESLFIDEGFGSLDPETLETAMAALDNLQATGRKVGVISHVQGLAEHIGAQVLVTKRGSGRSGIQVVSH